MNSIRPRDCRLVGLCCGRGTARCVSNFAVGRRGNHRLRPFVCILQDRPQAPVLACFGKATDELDDARNLHARIALSHSRAKWIMAERVTGFVIFGTALAFLFCQAKILHLARGIPAWRVPLIPWMIVASGLLEGLGLLALALAWNPSWQQSKASLPVAGLVLVAINVALWVTYRTTATQQGIGPLARQVLRRTSLPLHLVGHVMPAFGFAMAIIELDHFSLYLFVGGAAAIAGGALWKFSLIVHAGYQQGFALDRVPQRGSGNRAAPPRLPIRNERP